MTDQPRLIESAFPLKQASLESVHEKNVRHGHISTLHIWPARRPLALAACRAAPRRADRHALARPGNTRRSATPVRENRRQGGQENREKENAQQANRRAGEGGDRGGVSCIGAGRPRTPRPWNGSVKESAKPTGGGLRRFSMESFFKAQGMFRAGSPKCRFSSSSE